MQSYEQAVFVTAPAATVFDYLTNQARLSEWLVDVVSSEIVGGGPMQAGTKLRQVRKQGDKTVTGEVTVVAYDAPYEQAVQCNIMGVKTTFTFELAPQAGRTRVNLRSDFQGSGLSIILEPVVALLCKGCNERSLTQLKTRIEAGQPLAAAIV